MGCQEANRDAAGLSNKTERQELPAAHSHVYPSSESKTSFRGSVNHAEPKSRSEKIFFPK